VIHLASLFIASHQVTDLDRLIESNISLGLHLLEAMDQAGIRKLIATGTAWQHANGNTYQPANLYAATKQAFEDLTRYYSSTNRIRTCLIRLYDTAGPGDERPKLFWALNQARLQARPIEMSPGQQRLNLLHVDDVVAGLIHAVEMMDDSRVAEIIYAIRHSDELTLREIVAEYQNVTLGKPDVRWGARPYRSGEIMSPPHNIPVLPGWAPQLSVREVIRSVALSHLGNPNAAS
jgi:nucleoside-diphosphate-sugar epimerase